MEVDGVRVAHTGDQIFFRETDAAYGPEARPFTNHVYKNGLDIGCYRETVGYLQSFRPELVLTGHTLPYRPDDAWYGKIESVAAAFDDVHFDLMSLSEDEVHFGAESQGGKLKPYQAHAPQGATVRFEGWILNPFPAEKKARLALVGPEGWESENVAVDLGPREQVDIRIEITPPEGTVCRRQPVGLDLTVGDRPFGQVAEALVTVGCPRF